MVEAEKKDAKVAEGAGGAAADGGQKNLLLDEATGEMVSKK